jgi:hypothetical protein
VSSIWGQLAIIILGVLHAAAAFFYFSRARYAGLWASAWLVFATLAAVIFPQKPLWAALAVLVAVLAWTVWWASIRALSGRDWVVENARQATGEFVDHDVAIVHDVRSFEWRDKHDFIPRWETRRYDVRDLVALDLFVSTWADPRMAHLILSFVFRAGPPLAFSIETRREKTEVWSSLAGFMKSYELIMIAGDETDLIYCRTNVRRETVRLYRIATTEAMRRRLFLQYVKTMNRLARHPRFYNTLFSNCTTEIVRIVRAAGRRLRLDWRLLVSGYVPEYLYEESLLDTRLPFAELQRAADIGERARAGGAIADFPQRIRAGLPDPNR